MEEYGSNPLDVEFFEKQGLAMLRLARNATYTKDIFPICLPDGHETNPTSNDLRFWEDCRNTENPAEVCFPQSHISGIRICSKSTVKARLGGGNGQSLFVL